MNRDTIPKYDIDHESIKGIAIQNNEVLRLASIDESHVQRKMSEVAVTSIIEEGSSEIEDLEIQEGLTLKGRLAIELGVDPSTVDKTAMIHYASHPEWFISHTDNAGHIRTHYHPNLADLVREELSNQKPALEGWMAGNTLARELGRAPSTIHRTASQFEDEHPEWFGVYKVPTGQLSLHYHPELVSQIRQELSNREAAPEGWMTNHILAKDLGVDYSTVKKLANLLCENQPQWTACYQDKVKKLVTHYHPDLVDQIRSKITERQAAPKEWMTNYSVSEELGVSFNVVRRIANLERHQHPEWFRVYDTSSTHINTEHYHPNLIQIIREKALEHEVATTDWYPRQVVAQNAHVGIRNVEQTAEKYRDYHPEWFKFLRRANLGRAIEHYHSELVAIIAQELEEHGSAPEDWTTASSIATDIGFNHRGIKSRVTIYRDEHPEWFKLYRDRMGRVTEFYHPDLSTQIKMMLEDEMKNNLGKQQSEQEQENLKNNMQELLVDIEKGESLQAKEFKSLVSLFGAERAVDILYQQHPEYKKLPVPYSRLFRRVPTREGRLFS